MEVKEAKAIVTGAAAGIGRAVAELLAELDAAVVVADVDDEAGHRTAAHIGASFVHADMTSDEDVSRLFDEAERRLGGIEVFVNNAGGVDDPHYPLAPVAQWSAVLDLDLRSVLLATQLALERIEAGVVVAISSVAALGNEPHAAPEYAAAKAAVVRFVTALPARDDVRLVCVCPDSTRTPAMERTLASKPPGFDSGLMLEPRDVAETVVDLIRDDEARGRVLCVRAGEPVQTISN